MTEPLGRLGGPYGPLDSSVNGPFRGRGLTWEQYEQALPHDLSGSAFWCKVPEGHKYRRVGITWVIGYGYVGSLREDTHTVTEHDDGTISVTPSLIIQGLHERWHGHLTRGVFTGAFERGGS